MTCRTCDVYVDVDRAVYIVQLLFINDFIGIECHGHKIAHDSEVGWSINIANKK